MLKRIPSVTFETLRQQAQSRMHWERVRKNHGWNYAQAAAAHGISVREWAMLECGVTPEDLRAGLYPRAAGGRPSRHAGALQGSAADDRAER